MNRHGYKVRKFGREKDQRRALIKGLANELVLQESIETTLPKAKAVAKYTEKLISKSKKGKDNLHIRRQIISSLTTLGAAHKLVDELSPKLSGRNSGYLSVERTIVRRGDGTQMAKVGFVDDLKAKTKDGGKLKTSQKTDKTKEEVAPKKISEKGRLIPQKKVESHGQKVAQAPKRSGRRGDR